MNYYCITYRLDVDNNNEKRYYEGFADSFEQAVNDIIFKHRSITSDLFTGIVIISKSIYKSVFK